MGERSDFLLELKMIRYYERVPAAVISRDETGMVAYGLHKLITRSDGHRTVAKMKRAILHRVAYVKNGEAFLVLGGAADKKGVTADLPFAVTWERVA
jgi:hypothetical protein